MDRTGMSAGVVTAVDHLRELAGPRLYLRNPFRLTGLPTDVNRRVVRAARQRVESGGMPAPASGELAVAATEAELVAALEELGDPGRRIVGEVFWLWGTDKPRCGCTGEFHAEHDEAVRAHALALDLEAEPEEREVADALWLAAAKLWSELLRRAEFWEHLRHRVADLEDDGLDQTVLAALHAELPRALVMPLAVLATGSDEPDRLVVHARRWEVGASVLDEALADAAEQHATAPDQQAAGDSPHPAPEPDSAEGPAVEPEPVARMELSGGTESAGEPAPVARTEPAGGTESAGEPAPVARTEPGDDPEPVGESAPVARPEPSGEAAPAGQSAAEPEHLAAPSEPSVRPTPKPRPPVPRPSQPEPRSSPPEQPSLPEPHAPRQPPSPPVPRPSPPEPHPRPEPHAPLRPSSSEPHGDEPLLPRQRGTEPAETPYEAPNPEQRPVAYPPAESFLDAAFRREHYQPEAYHIEQFPTDVFATRDFNQPARRQRSGDVTGFYLALLTAAILIAVVILVLA